MRTDIWDYSEAYSKKPMKMKGFKVDPTDGEIGKVDEATYDVGTSYIVVHRSRIFGRRCSCRPA